MFLYRQLSFEFADDFAPALEPWSQVASLEASMGAQAAAMAEVARQRDEEAARRCAPGSDVPHWLKS